ncbi:aminodeoxychorismate synthase component I [bacterium]|nr:aminodeoxychorismate synthase component I [bacterium]MCP5462310.1 aminodeoxychorismate synthase component I [bacterium]
MSIPILHDAIFTDDTFFLFLSLHEENPNQPVIAFKKPIEIISAHTFVNVAPALEKVRTRCKQGYYSAGYLSYEAGLAFEKKFSLTTVFSQPLVWFGIFEKTESIHCSCRELQQFFDEIVSRRLYTLTDLHANISYAEYHEAIQKIKKYIGAGDIYQANFTYKYHFSFSGIPFGLFAALIVQQPVGYGSFIQTRENAVISLSPELFFDFRDRNIVVKPMKGTAKRGRTIDEDEIARFDLHVCEKNRAENVMIVDLLRNDLGKICETGSINVHKLFEVIQYNRLFQMISIINGTVNPQNDFPEIIRNIFPSGSVIGAPKIRAMEIISELEKESRGIYTGSIGYVCPNGDAVFNVAIRTVYIDRMQRKGELGIGSGIVADSNPEKEFEECNLKAQFLTRQQRQFHLVETILWEDGGFFLCDLHCKRLGESAQYFGYPFDFFHLKEKLSRVAQSFPVGRGVKVRVLLNKYGEFFLEYSLVQETAVCGFMPITFSDTAVDKNDVFLFHKTTNRKLYERKFKECRQNGYYDVLFVNEQGEITEGTISNVFIQVGNLYFTPPVDCGLLNGVFRQHFIAQNQGKVFEKVLYKEDLFNADCVFLTNSVRKKVNVLLNKEIVQKT